MTDPVQEAIPGTDVPQEPVRRRRGRPKGSKNPKAGTLFSDGLGDFRLYVIEETGQLTPVNESGGFPDRAAALRWLQQNGGREDLLGHQVLLSRALSLVRVAMKPTLQFKPRGKVARTPDERRAAQEQEVETGSPAT
jgi:hypothetical protein